MVRRKGVVVNGNDRLCDATGVEGDADVHVREAMEGGVVVEGEDNLRVLEASEGPYFVIMREAVVEKVSSRYGVIDGNVGDWVYRGDDDHCALSDESRRSQVSCEMPFEASWSLLYCPK